MTHSTQIFPGVTLSCHRDTRFKQGLLTFSLVRPMAKEEAAMNALIPAVLFRGTRKHPDIRSITLHLDDLYGATVGTQVRRLGDYQITGFYCAFLEDRFALNGDRILAPMIDFLGEILMDPLTQNGTFCPAYFEGERTNLIACIESEINSKGAYAMNQLMQQMCKEDSFGVPRLGSVEDVAGLDIEKTFAHYKTALQESPILITYVGSATTETVTELLQPLLKAIPRNYLPIGPQTGFHDSGSVHLTEQMDVAQGKLCLAYTTPLTCRSEGFVAMQLVNAIFGGGMTSKLFTNVREKQSLCYSIGSSYVSSKGLITVSAGIDFADEEKTRAEIARQLEAIQQGDISSEELHAAKQAILSSLRSTYDSAGSINSYFTSTALTGMNLEVEDYMKAVENMTAEEVSAAARTVVLHSSYFLKGVNP